jgi:hypothetical protein
MLLEGQAMDRDSANNIYIAGRIAGEGRFGKGEANPTLLNTNMPSGYVAKYTPDGTLVWAKLVGISRVNGIALSPDGNNIFLTGILNGSTNIGGIELNRFTDPNLTGYVLISLNRNGEPLWARAPESGESEGIALTFNPTSGQLLVRGNQYTDLTLHHDLADEVNLREKPNYPRSFVASYLSDGSLSWATQFGTFSETQQSHAIDTDDQGNAYVAYAASTSSNTHVFVLQKFNSSGIPHESYFNEPIDDSAQAKAITVNTRGSIIYAAGEFTGSIDLDTGWQDAPRAVRGGAPLSQGILLKHTI